MKNNDCNITLDGLDFELPEDVEKDLTPLDYGITRDEGKQKTKYFWLRSYERDFKNNVFSCQSYLLECSSRGTITLEGKKLKDKNDIETASRIFGFPIFQGLK